LNLVTEIACPQPQSQVARDCIRFASDSHALANRSIVALEVCIVSPCGLNFGLYYAPNPLRNCLFAGIYPSFDCSQFVGRNPNAQGSNRIFGDEGSNYFAGCDQSVT
jgi:hypothetical protein